MPIASEDLANQKFEASNLIMLNYDNSLCSSAWDTKLRIITCNYLYKKLKEKYSHKYFDC